MVVLAVLSAILFASADLVAQSRFDISVEKTGTDGVFRVTNRSEVFTARVSISVVWNKLRPNPDSPGSTIPFVVQTSGDTTLSPGRSGTITLRAPFKYGETTEGMSGWLWNVDFPYKTMERQRWEAAKRQKELARQQEERLKKQQEEQRRVLDDLKNRKREDVVHSTTPFHTFLDRLQRSGRPHDYYPGDSQMGAGYYDQNGTYLGATDPGSRGVPGRNPELDRFGAPLSLSNFDKRYPDDSAPSSPSSPYAGMLPLASLSSAPSQPPSAPAWAFDRQPTTWTDQYGNVFLVEPLPPELRGLTPEQLGYLPKPPAFDPSGDDFAFFLRDNASDRDWTPEATADSAWKNAGIDMSPPSPDDLSDEDFERLYNAWQAKTTSANPVASAYWDAKEQEIRREIAERKQREEEGLGGGWLAQAVAKIAEEEADRIIAFKQDVGQTPPDRETALREAWAAVTGGGRYMSDDEKRRWNANADRLGITNPALRYKIDDAPAAAGDAAGRTPGKQPLLDAPDATTPATQGKEARP